MSMSLDDSRILVPECPVCSSIDVETSYWAGAWTEDWEDRIMLDEGVVKELQCRCNMCGHEWAEYVKGRSRYE